MQLRTLTLTGTDPARHGEQHGEAFRADIQAAWELRLRLTLERTDLGTVDNVLALARHHLPLLQRFDAGLYAELHGIARGAGLTAEQIVVLNHYTSASRTSTPSRPSAATPTAARRGLSMPAALTASASSGRRGTCTARRRTSPCC